MSVNSLKEYSFMSIDSRDKLYTIKRKINQILNSDKCWVSFFSDYILEQMER